MGESFLITLREGFEAALIVAIVLAFVKRSPAPGMARAVWAGTAAALGLAAVVGIVIHLTIDDLQGEARARTFAGICIAAAALLTWMIFWMRTHARGLKAELEGRADQAVKESSSVALAMVAFTAVAREGLERPCSSSPPPRPAAVARSSWEGCWAWPSPVFSGWASTGAPGC